MTAINSDNPDLEDISVEILSYFEEEKVMTKLSILYEYAKKHDDSIPARELSMWVCEALKNLINQRRLIESYDKNIKPENALTSDIYYTLPRQ